MHKLYFQARFQASEQKDGVIKISGFASTPDIDRYNDRVLPSAFVDGLPVFMTNPKMLLGHDDAKVIGKYTDCQVEQNGLRVVGEVMYNIDDCVQKIEDGTLNTFSIGFITKAYQYEDSVGHIIYKSDVGLMA